VYVCVCLEALDFLSGMPVSDLDQPGDIVRDEGGVSNHHFGGRDLRIDVLVEVRMRKPLTDEAHMDVTHVCHDRGGVSGGCGGVCVSVEVRGQVRAGAGRCGPVRAGRCGQVRAE
jgi:hypothetical protein